MKRRDYLYVAVIVALFFALYEVHRKGVVVETRVDTLVVCDTIRDTVRTVVARQLIRCDTVWLKATRDTVFVKVEVPVEQKIYQTADYRAVVEGFRPRLTEIEIYRNTSFITQSSVATSLPNAKQSRHWSIGIQAGYGIGGSTKPTPYIGIGLQYNLITF
jgi:hypothetical protein